MEVGAVRNLKSDERRDKVEVTALVSDKFTTSVFINNDLKIIDGKCTCNHYYRIK